MARILYVITKANWGGAQRYVFDLACAARHAGHEVAIAYGEPGTLEEKLRAARLRGIRMPVRNETSLLAVVRACYALRSALRHEQPDVVHLNSSLVGLTGALVARMVGVKKILFTAHGWTFNESRPWWQRVVLYALAWMTMLLSHTVICVSEAVLRDIAWMPFVRRRCVVIYNGVTCPALLPREEARRAIAPHGVGRIWIGMLSELHTTKRVEDAVRAFSLIAPAHPEVILIVLGEGRERIRIENVVRSLHLTERVSLPGFRSDAATLLHAFDLFVHASESEALGYAILEAGCAGLPVVATRVGGIPEIIPDDAHGLLVPPRDPEALAEAVEALMRDPRRAAEQGARLKARVARVFSKEEMLSRTLALYH